MGLIAGAVVAAGAAAGTSYLMGQAKKDALHEQREALRNLQFINVDQYKREAFRGDKQEYLNRFKIFRQGDPELAKVRDQAISNLLSTLEGEDVNVQKIANLLTGRATEDDSRLKDIEGQLLDRAKEKLELGATLPPEFQAELIRSGLETAGATGIGANREGPLAQLLGRRIGSEQLALEQQREAQALALAGGAQALQQNRVNILRGIAPELQNLNIARSNLALNSLGAATAGMPASAGLGGRDILSLLESNRDLKNKQTLALADLAAAKHLVSGETAAGYLGAGTSALTSILGGMGGGGGMGGMLGGMGGASGAGGGFNIGSLLGGFGQTSYIPGSQEAAGAALLSTPTARRGTGALGGF